jgi:hypothetical protein
MPMLGLILLGLPVAQLNGWAFSKFITFANQCNIGVIASWHCPSSFCGAVHALQHPGPTGEARERCKAQAVAGLPPATQVVVVPQRGPAECAS